MSGKRKGSTGGSPLISTAGPAIKRPKVNDMRVLDGGTHESQREVLHFYQSSVKLTDVKYICTPIPDSYDPVQDVWSVRVSPSLFWASFSVLDDTATSFILQARRPYSAFERFVHCVLPDAVIAFGNEIRRQHDQKGTGAGRGGSDGSVAGLIFEDILQEWQRLSDREKEDYVEGEEGDIRVLTARINAEVAVRLDQSMQQKVPVYPGANAFAFWIRRQGLSLSAASPPVSIQAWKAMSAADRYLLFTEMALLFVQYIV